jgi:hypothetical protein
LAAAGKIRAVNIPLSWKEAHQGCKGIEENKLPFSVLEK